MSHNKIIRLSEEFGVSKMTIRRALEHCPGVGSKLREQILSFEPLPAAKNGDKDVYVIMPEIPAFFWGPLFLRLGVELRKRDLSVKYNVYSEFPDKSIVEAYLNESDELGARCVIIAAATGTCEERLQKFAENRAVFTICNQIYADNVFFFGSDHEKDGRLLGEKCLEMLPDAETYVLVGRYEDRCKGFLSAVKGKNIIHLESGYRDSQIDIARKLAPIAKEHKIDVVVGLDGVSQKIAMALKKCHITAEVFSFENQKVEARYQQPMASVCQDLERIAEEVAIAAEHYIRERTFPSEKENYIASKLVY